VSQYADRLFEEKILEPSRQVTRCDLKRNNLFQGDSFLQDTDFLFLSDEKLFKVPKEKVVGVWEIMGCANLCPCDWFMKFN
jgi:hypothetical protein